MKFLFNYYTGPPKWIPGLFFAALAVFFWFKACPAIQPVEEGMGSSAKTSPEKSPASIPTVFALSTLSCLILAGFLFHFNYPFLGALPALALLGLLFWRRSEVFWAKSVPLPTYEWAGICLVVGVAVLLRFPFLGKNYFGLQIDEANGWWNALAVSLNPISPFSLIGDQTPALPDFFLGAFFKVFGTNLVAGHVSTALASVVASYFFYRWCRLHFGFSSSIIASLLFTVSWWNLFFSFSGICNIYLLTFETGAFYFLDKGFRFGAKKDFALSGLCFGLVFFMYWAGRIVPLTAAAAIVVFLVLERGRFIKAYSRALLITLFILLLVVGPFLVFWHYTPSGVVWSRFGELSILKIMLKTHNVFLPVQTSFWTLLGYFCPLACVIDPRFCSPGDGLIDGFSSVFLLLGIFLCLVNWKRRVVFMVAGGLAMGIAANALAAQNLPACPNYINPCRSFVIFPYVFMFVARGLDWFIGQTLRFRPAFARTVGIFLISAGLLYAVGMNLGIYFYRFGHNSNWGDLGFDHLRIAEELPKYYPKDHILLFSAYDNTPVRFVNFEKLKYTPLNGLDLPLKFQVNKDVALFFPPSVFESNREKMSRFYPGAKSVALRDPWGQEFFDVVEIPQDEVVKAQKGISLLPLIP